ncbi:MAG: hypothetical protein HBSAPP02_25540 [Phycisphaerae bacterium]|nr:MAG: GNAT family N-acetyltransferase [Planctomycetia bacterium]RIK69090.1 MAG: hypothetical protein DCC66_09475 [Planctomycetota bacterium]GJQ27522.1 MAG: hypothetical protein HBSAPP02_25540 [Phycisphaerae bacterium]
MNRRRIFALVLAAGPSRRMGRPKLLLEYGGGTILEAVLDAVFDSPLDGAVIVTTPEIEALLRDAVPPDVAVALNHDADSNVITSVKLGLSKVKTRYHLQDDDGIVVMLGDMPEITSVTVSMCAEMYRMAKQPRMLVATYHGVRSYPVIVPFSRMLEVFCWDRPRVLEELWERPGADVRELPIGLCPKPIDVDTPEDYERLLAIHRASVPRDASPPRLRLIRDDEEKGRGTDPALSSGGSRADERDAAAGLPLDWHISVAKHDDEIAACWPVMAELRPHVNETEFVARVHRQAASGYRLARLEAAGRVVSVAGYRIGENLSWGRHLYVDDLVTAAAARSKGYGEALFNWLVEEARRNECDALHLDSGVQRFAAHRFYLAMRMDITSHHFAIKLK